MRVEATDFDVDKSDRSQSADDLAAEKRPLVPIGREPTAHDAELHVAQPPLDERNCRDVPAQEEIRIAQRQRRNGEKHAAPVSTTRTISPTAFSVSRKCSTTPPA